MMPDRLIGQHLPCDNVASDDVIVGLNLLGSIRFSLAEGVQAWDSDKPCLTVPLPVLGVSQADNCGVNTDISACCEVLLTDAVVHSGQIGDIRYAMTDDLLFAVLTREEGEEPAALQQASEDAYAQMFALLNAHDYPHVWRYWNYMAAINEPSDGLERYRQFNLGRQAAFDAAGRNLAEHVTAACALGFATPQQLPSGLCVALLAGKTKPVPIENPRQVRAMDYPLQYGPRSPLFSRAALARLDDQSVLFVSGTASIVGHESVHPNDVVAQTRETLTNIEAIVTEANRLLSANSGQPAFNLADLSYRVYVRHAADMSHIHAEMVRWIGVPVDALFLQADVCRQELLVEIEISPASAYH
ncbi:MAG TPA: hypothetical protein VMV35_03255 [Halothiobacillus sp.]|nr:hypothetical protein [Halothiobacillus sp.]